MPEFAKPIHEVLEKWDLQSNQYIAAVHFHSSATSDVVYGDPSFKISRQTLIDSVGRVKGISMTFLAPSVDRRHQGLALSSPTTRILTCKGNLFSSNFLLLSIILYDSAVILILPTSIDWQCHLLENPHRLL